MGVLEAKLKKKIRRNSIQLAVLATVAGVGIISIALVAPGIGPMFKLFGLEKIGRKRDKIRQARYRLVDQGMLQYAKRGYLEITERGRKKLGQLRLQHYEIETTKKWDGRWRVLIFDIMEKRRNKRDGLRKELRERGFQRLQDSVWVYPHDCEDYVTLLKAEFELGKSMLYMIVDTLEYDNHLRERFGVEK